MKTLYIETDALSGEQLDERPYYSDVMIAEGSSLDEILDSAVLFYSDQDGGEGPQVKVSDLSKALRERAERILEDEWEGHVREESDPEEESRLRREDLRLQAWKDERGES